MRKSKRGGQLPDDLLNIAAGAGYNLTSLSLADLAYADKAQQLASGSLAYADRGQQFASRGLELHDEVMNNVAGGFIDKEDLCRTLITIFGADLEYCVDNEKER